MVQPFSGTAPLPFSGSNEIRCRFPEDETDGLGLPTFWSEGVGNSAGTLFPQPGDPLMGDSERDAEDRGRGFRRVI